MSCHANKIKEISNEIGWHRDFDGKISALIDTASTQRTLASIKSVADLFLECGIKVNPKVNKNLFDGISKVKEYLKHDNNLPNIYIFNTCKHLIRELKGYMWGENEIPIKKDDHALDELRYFVMSLPNERKQTQSELSVIQKDKRRLQRKRGKYE